LCESAGGGGSGNVEPKTVPLGEGKKRSTLPGLCHSKNAPAKHELRAA
jgi:hypothetical protein